MKSSFTPFIYLHPPGIEPGASGWQPKILPLNHECGDRIETIIFK